MCVVVRSVAILPDMWCFQWLFYLMYGVMSVDFLRCVVQGQSLSCLIFGVRLVYLLSSDMSVAILPDFWCCVSGYPA